MLPQVSDSFLLRLLGAPASGIPGAVPYFSGGALQLELNLWHWLVRWVVWGRMRTANVAGSLC
eukprot:scaffold99483_cov15-Tisochrysis_lutea.AAC.1